MNLALASVKKKVISWMVIILTVAGGFFAYQNLGRLENPEFTIKDAKVYTNYPGATAQEVEEEVTDPLEKAVQELGQLKEMQSLSRAGFSEITVTIQDKYTKNDLPQVWDELRRKIGDVQSQLPPGAQTSIVFDDFGDVYGLYLAMTGEGYTQFDLDKFSDSLRTQLLLVSGISKITIGGVQNLQIFIEISRYRLSQLGISEQDIYNVVAQQNLVEPGGTIRLDDDGVRILPTGQHQAIEDISNLVVTSSSTGKQFRLKDIAQVSQGYQEVPTFITRYNGKPAITLAISATSGTNIVELGYHIKDKLEELKPLLPPGIELHPIYMQSDVVEKSVNGFVVSLLQALAIVIVVLLVSMGLRSGLIIGGVLLLSVLGTLLFMYLFAIDLERISLGALIIALGMLLDNAIVVTEGILIGIQKGQNSLVAVKETVQQNQWPLLGATVIGILAFAAIGLSQDNTGEYLRTLFYVIGISLTLSWIFAITITPMLCVDYLPAPKKDQENVDPYAGGIYQKYKGFLEWCLKHKSLTFISMLLLLGLSLIAFRLIPQGFFPDSTTPIFYVDYWREQGTDIRALNQDMQEVEEYILSQPEVTNVTSFVGQGAARFMLVYSPEGTNSSYGQFIVEVQDSAQIPALEERIFQHLRQNNTQAELKTKRVVLGTGGGNKIEARFLGPDPIILRTLSEQAQAMMAQDPKARNIRDDWRNREVVLRPTFDEQRARQVGISRSDINRTLNLVYSGLQVGIYRQKDDLIPIIARPPEKERYDINSMRSVSVWSTTLNASIPMSQVTSDVNLEWEDGIVRRRWATHHHGLLRSGPR